MKWYCPTCQSLTEHPTCALCGQSGHPLDSEVCGHPSLVIGPSSRHEIRYCPRCKRYSLVARV